MDRRQQKTREAIFKAFITLLSKKSFNKITVGEIIDCANIGRATFYAHFETKDFLLKELSRELFDHIFEAQSDRQNMNNHIFNCDAPNSVFLHLFQHLKNNDNNILELLVCENNDLFLTYFKDNLKLLIKNQLPVLEIQKPEILPEDFWINHICSSFVETVRWWISDKMSKSPELITEYFLCTIKP